MPADAATPLAAEVAGIRTTAQRFHGRGGSVVTLDTALAGATGGTLAVALETADGRRLDWYALRPASRMDDSAADQVATTSAGPHDTADDGTAPYYGTPPTTIVVQDPGSHDWTLTVAFLTLPSRRD